MRSQVKILSKTKIVSLCDTLLAWKYHYIFYESELSIILNYRTSSLGKEKIEYLMQGHALRERYLQDDMQILMTMIRMVLQRDHPRFLAFPLTLKSAMMKKMNKARRLERPLVQQSKIFFIYCWNWLYCSIWNHRAIVKRSCTGG